MAKSPPNSPDTQAKIDCYTPSDESQEEQDFFGRRRLRIAAGQDAEKQPEKFTPPPRHHWAHFVWPTNEEAYAWARGRRSARRRGPPTTSASGRRLSARSRSKS